MSEAPGTTSLSRQTDLRQKPRRGTSARGLRKWHYRAYQPHLLFCIERNTVYLVGYQRIGAANPLVGGVTQQADAARQTLALLDESTWSLLIPTTIYFHDV